MIASFRDKTTEDLYHGRNTKELRKFPIDIVKTVLRKLDLLNAATNLGDLRSYPGKHLKTLSGNLEGFYGMRINDQRRIIFQWEEKNAHNVMLTDYHA